MGETRVVLGCAHFCLISLLEALMGKLEGTILQQCTLSEFLKFLYVEKQIYMFHWGSQYAQHQEQLAYYSCNRSLKHKHMGGTCDPALRRWTMNIC